MYQFSSSDAADAYLVAHASRGDRDSYGALVERHQSAVCSVAYSVCGDFALSEDLGQDAFVAGWKKLTDLREPERFRSWVCGIARQLALSYVRKRSRRSDRAPDPDSMPELASTDAGPDQLVASEEEKALLWKALQRLPATYREPMVLFYREQQSLTAVAQALDLSEDAVKQRLSRGRVLLRQELTRVLTGVLGATRPSVVFTLAVMGALPPLLTATGMAVTATTAKAATTGGASAATSTIAVGAIAASLVSGVVGLLGVYVAFHVWRSPGVLPATRRILMRLAFASGGVLAGFGLGLVWLAGPGQRVFLQNGWSAPNALLLLILVYVIVNAALSTLAAYQLFNAQTTAMALRGNEVRAKDPLFRRNVSRVRFLGLPLLAVAYGADPAKGEARGVAKAWIAVGDIAWGGLVSVGTFSCAPIAIGTIAFGLLPIGGFAVGVCSLGFISLGGLSIGGVAMGAAFAIGGVAAAPHVAIGAIAVSGEWAIGARAFAGSRQRLGGDGVAPQRLDRRSPHACPALFGIFIAPRCPRHRVCASSTQIRSKIRRAPRRVVPFSKYTLKYLSPSRNPLWVPE